MNRNIRWGIVATGNISHQFAKALMRLDDAEIRAVSSRTREKAASFAEAFGIARCFTSVEDMVGSGEVDVVYIGSPHSAHYAQSRIALEAGVAVLCEKPVCINLGEAESLIALARGTCTYLMEAMWMFFSPAMVRVRELLAEGVIGRPQMLQANFCFRAKYDPAARLFNPALGGGALLDVGIYPIAFAHMVLGGNPVEILSTATFGETGVDEQNCVLLKYANGAIASLASATRTACANDGTIYGTEGYIRLTDSFHDPVSLVVKRGDEPEREEHLPGLGDSIKTYSLQAAAVMDDLRSGRLENALVTHAASLNVMRVMDCCRAQWGLTYPMET